MSSQTTRDEEIELGCARQSTQIEILTAYIDSIEAQLDDPHFMLVTQALTGCYQETVPHRPPLSAALSEASDFLSLQTATTTIAPEVHVHRVHYMASSANTQQSGHIGSSLPDEISPSPAESLPPIGAGVSVPPTSSEPAPHNGDHNAVAETTHGRKHTSPVWNHFRRVTINGELKATCNVCQKNLSASTKNGTHHLLEHAKRCARRTSTASDIGQCLLSASRESDGKTELKNHSYDSNLARLHLAYMVIMHDYPLRMVEHKGFRMFLNTIQPLFKPISRNTLRTDIMKIFNEEKSKIMTLLERNDSRIAITTDLWTASNQKKGYMAVTAHFIDNSWRLQSRILRFMYVSCPHTADVICESLFGCLMDWNIDSKLSTLTLDNCTTNDFAVGMLSILMNKFSPDSLLLSDVTYTCVVLHIF
ncbi:HAT family dimerisation domain containing protein [Striga asiatica]|uniref:HAT family dimerisation domain containing protein n=1 Tax=Striga asiatica TaxID=4170 RepID=A0A5A7QGQ1_STRAF|nr:HAT family dimerisation domain containing protein [Striga asiatica]